MLWLCHFYLIYYVTFALLSYLFLYRFIWSNLHYCINSTVMHKMYISPSVANPFVLPYIVLLWTLLHWTWSCACACEQEINWAMEHLVMVILGLISLCLESWQIITFHISALILRCIFLGWVYKTYSCGCPHAIHMQCTCNLLTCCPLVLCCTHDVCNTKCKPCQRFPS